MRVVSAPRTLLIWTNNLRIRLRSGCIATPARSAMRCSSMRQKIPPFRRFSLVVFFRHFSKLKIYEKRKVAKIFPRISMSMPSDIERSTRAVSGFKYVHYDGRQAAKSAPWSVHAGRYRSKGFATPLLAALHWHKCKDNPSIVALKCRKSMTSSTPLNRSIAVIQVPVPPILHSSSPPVPSPTSGSDWWNKSNVSMAPKEIDRMNLFGIRLQLTTNGPFADAPIYPIQKKAELSRLIGKRADAVVAKDVTRTLHNELVELAVPHVASDFTRDMLDKLSIQRLYAILNRAHPFSFATGTVVGYLPSSREHIILFDDASQRPTILSSRGQPYDAAKNVMHMDLLSDTSVWKRVAWQGNVLDDHAPSGERPLVQGGLLSYGPECPQCDEFLGVGAHAWTKCTQCGLMEPGAMWSKRIRSVRDDPHAWQQPSYH